MATRRQFFLDTAVLAAAHTLAVPAALAKQAAPADATTPLPGIASIVVGFPPGSSIDRIARKYAEKINGVYAERVIVENKPGAAGRIGQDFARRAAPDGKTILLSPSPLMTLYPLVYSNLTYDPVKDYVPAPTVYDSYLGVAVGPAVPTQVTTLEQFVEWAKARPDGIFYSANAQGAGPHIMGVRLLDEVGVDGTFVPYNSGNDAMHALLAGDIPMVVMSAGSLATPAKNGQIRMLATCSEERNQFFPDVPTLRELGYEDLVQGEWGALFFPASTPQAHVERLYRALDAAKDDADLKQTLLTSFIVPTLRDAAATRQALDEGLATYGPIVKAANIKAD